jgi:hypothetical protein
MKRREKRRGGKKTLHCNCIIYSSHVMNEKLFCYIMVSKGNLNENCFSFSFSTFKYTYHIFLASGKSY